MMNSEARKRNAEPDEAVIVSWYDHDRPWFTKFCDEHHRRYAVLPVAVLREYGVDQ